MKDKSIVFALSTLFISGDALPQTNPASGGLLGGLLPSLPSIPKFDLTPSPIKFDRSVNLKPEFRQDAKRTQYRYGPLQLVGKDDPIPPKIGIPSMDKHGESFRLSAERGFCSNCTVLAGKTGLQFQDGSEAKGVYIHHFLVIDSTKTENSPIEMCPPSSGWLPSLMRAFRRVAGFIGQGDDNGSSAIYFAPNDPEKMKSGFHMGSNDKMMFVTDLVNYNREPKDVYLTIDIEYVDGLVGLDAVSTLLSVTGCDFSKAPATSKNGPTTSKSEKFPILKDGFIVSAKGHMHDGGERMILYINDQPVCTSEAAYADESDTSQIGTIRGMSRCGDPISVKKGDILTMSSVYDLKKHAARTDVHGGGEVHGSMAGMDFMGMWALTFTTDPRKV